MIIKISIIFYCIFTIMCLVMPTGFNFLKVLIYLFSLSMLVIRSKKIKFAKNEIEFCLIFLLISFFYFFLGIINDNLGVYKTVRIYLYYPIFLGAYYFFIRTIKIDNIFGKYFTKVLDISLIIILIDVFLFILYSYGKINFHINFPNNTYNINIENGELIEVSIKSLGSLNFLIPYYITEKFQSRMKIKDIIMLPAVFFIAVFSGRSILFITFLLTLAFNIFFIIKNKKMKIVFFLLALLSIIYFFNVFFDQIKIILMKLTTGTRFFQAKYILIDFLKKPFFGHGIGACVSNKEYIKSIAFPWAYEYSYLVFLLNFGIFGTCFYFYALLKNTISIFLKKNKILYPIGVGWLMFLIANASNPYLGKLDYINLFLFIIIIIKKQRGKNEEKVCRCCSTI